MDCSIGRKKGQRRFEVNNSLRLSDNQKIKRNGNGMRDFGDVELFFDLKWNECNEFLDTFLTLRSTHSNTERKIKKSDYD